MNAESVHGGGEMLASISARFGRRGQYAPAAAKGELRGMATLNGLHGALSVISSSNLDSTISASTLYSEMS